MLSPGRVYTTSAIILKRTNAGETDRVVTVFSKEHGRMKVMAKGIRRVGSRRAAHLEVFSHVLLVLHKGKTWDLVTEATPIRTHAYLREHLTRVSHAYYLCELVDALLPERQEQPAVYQLLADALRTLNDERITDLTGNGEQFALALLRQLGYLAPDRELSSGQIDPYIEGIIEKRIRTPRLLMKLF